MTKFSKYILLSSLALCCFVLPASATIKWDIAQLGNQGTKLPGIISGIQADITKSTEHVKTYMKMLDGAKEGLSKIKDLQKGVKDLKGSMESSINQLSSQVTDSVNTLVGSNAQELISAQNSLAKSKSECEEKIKKLEASRDAAVNKYKENNKLLEEEAKSNPALASANQEKIRANNQRIAEIETKCQQSVAETKAVHDEINQKYTDTINQLQSAASNIDPLSNVNADSAKKALSGLFGGDSGAAMNEVIAKNFYKDGEEDSTERNGELNNYRRDTALNDSADVYYKSTFIMSQGDDNLEYTKSLQNNAQVVETTPAAVLLDLSLKVETLKVMLNYARLLVAEMKMATAKDMVGLNKRLNNYEKDVTEFNLDDYEYKK